MGSYNGWRSGRPPAQASRAWASERAIEPDFEEQGEIDRDPVYVFRLRARDHVRSDPTQSGTRNEIAIVYPYQRRDALCTSCGQRYPLFYAARTRRELRRVTRMCTRACVRVQTSFFDFVVARESGRWRDYGHVAVISRWHLATELQKSRFILDLRIDLNRLTSRFNWWTDWFGQDRSRNASFTIDLDEFNWQLVWARSIRDSLINNWAWQN